MNSPNLIKAIYKNEKLQVEFLYERIDINPIPDNNDEVYRFARQNFIILCLIFCTQLFLLHGCKTNIESKDNIIKIELPDINAENYKVDNSLIIKLETKDDVLLGYLSDVKIKGDTVYVLDQFYKRLYLFHINGKYIDKIENVGKGPLEYLKIYDFALYENDIYILCSRKIVVFDAINLKAKKEIKLDFDALSLAVGDKNIILSTHQSSTGYILNYMSKLDLDIDKYMKATIKSGDNSYQLVYSAYKFNSIPNDGRSLFHYSYGDLIYIVSDSGYQCAYQVDLKDKCVPNNILAKNPDAILNYTQNNDHMNIEKCYKIGNTLAICLFSRMQNSNDTNDFLINTPNGTFYYSSIIDKNLELPITFMGACTQGFIGFFSSEELEKKKEILLSKITKGEELRSNEKNFLAEFKDNSNPYLVIFNFTN